MTGGRGKPWVNADDGRNASIERKGKALHYEKQMAGVQRGREKP